MFFNPRLSPARELKPLLFASCSISTSKGNRALEERREKQVKGKCGFRPTTGHESPEGEYKYRYTCSLTSTLDVVGREKQEREREREEMKPGFSFPKLTIFSRSRALILG